MERTPVIKWLALAAFQMSISPPLSKTRSCCLYGSLWKPVAASTDGLAESGPGKWEAVVNLTVLGGGWKKNGNLAEWQPETWHEMIIS